MSTPCGEKFRKEDIMEAVNKERRARTKVKKSLHLTGKQYRKLMKEERKIEKARKEDKNFLNKEVNRNGKRNI